MDFFIGNSELYFDTLITFLVVVFFVLFYVMLNKFKVGVNKDMIELKNEIRSVKKPYEEMINNLKILCEEIKNDRQTRYSKDNRGSL